MPESVNRRGSSGPTIGAIVRCSSAVAMWPCRLPPRPSLASLCTMHVRVRLFAGLRERAGTAEVELELPDGAVVGDALTQVARIAGDTPVVMAVNHEYADAAAPLHPGDELALIPP